MAARDCSAPPAAKPKGGKVQPPVRPVKVAKSPRAARDPRFVKTIEALEASLCDGPFMRRYEAPDDFGKPETAFNVCSFWRQPELPTKRWSSSRMRWRPSVSVVPGRLVLVNWKRLIS